MAVGVVALLMAGSVLSAQAAPTAKVAAPTAKVAAPAASVAAADEACGPIDERFTVRRGDQLGMLVQRLALPRCTWARVARANRLKNANLIRPGQVLQMPRGVVRLRDSLAHLAAFSGDVRWAAPEGQPAVAAKVGDPLTIARVLETGARSSARVWLDTGIEARLLSGSKASLAELAWSGKGGMQAVLSLSQGRMVVKMPADKAPAADERRLRVRTPSMVLAVRGTQFEVSTQANAAWVSTFEGNLAVTAAGRTLDLPAGQGVAVDADLRTVHSESLLPAPALPDLPAQVSRLPVSFDLGNTQPARWRALLARDAALVDVVDERLLDWPVANWGLLPPGRYVMAVQQVSDLGIAGMPAQHAFEVGVQATLLGPGRWMSPDWLAQPEGMALDLPTGEADQTLLVQLSRDEAGAHALWQAVSSGGVQRLPADLAPRGAWLHVWRVESARP